LSTIFDQFDDTELLQLWQLAPQNERVRAAIEQASTDGDLAGLQDDAYNTYWHRRLDKCATLTDSAVAELLRASPQSAVRGVLGEAALREKLTDDQVLFLLTQLEEREWSYRQLVARSLVSSYRLMSIQKRQFDHERYVERLLELRTTWAILELVPSLTAAQLDSLQSKLVGRDVLTKWDRHVVKERIYQELSSRGLASRRGRWGPA
jgi:hypothetical protein